MQPLFSYTRSNRITKSQRIQNLKQNKYNSLEQQRIDYGYVIKFFREFNISNIS